jgi:hypothetical protein
MEVFGFRLSASGVAGVVFPQSAARGNAASLTREKASRRRTDGTDFLIAFLPGNPFPLPASN